MEDAVKAARGGYVSRYLPGDLSAYYTTVGRCSDAESLLELVLEWNDTQDYIKSIEFLQDRIGDLCMPQN